MNPVNRDATIEELRARMARAQLYVVSIRRTERFGGSGPDEAADYSRQHLLYLWQLEAEGKLFGAGPFERDAMESEPWAC